MGLLRYGLLLVTFYIFTGCGVQLDTVLKNPLRMIDEINNQLDIELPATTGNVIRLNRDLVKPTIIIFAQDTCDVCGHETEMLISHLPNGVETKVQLTTILIGTTLEDAQWWQEMFEVPWPVGIDFAGRYFKQYCSENTVPCLLIYYPGKGIVFRQHGEVSFETIHSYTGDWY